MPAPCVPVGNVRSLSFFPVSLLGTSVVMVTLEVDLSAAVYVIVFFPAALAVHWNDTLFVVLPLPSALFQLPPATSLTTNEFSSPIPTVVRSCVPPGLAQPLVTAIAGPWAGGLSRVSARYRGSALWVALRVLVASRGLRFGCCTGRELPPPNSPFASYRVRDRIDVSRRFSRSCIRIQTHFAKVVADSRLHEAASCWVFDF